jgi:hypothetical protein
VTRYFSGAALAALPATLAALLGASVAVGAAVVTGAVTGGVPEPLNERNNTQARMTAPRIASGTSQREPLAAAESTLDPVTLYLPTSIVVKSSTGKKAGVF